MAKSNLSHQRDLPLIGWREWIGLPSLGIARIKAKIDTGARTSAIHAANTRRTKERGGPAVAFIVYPMQNSADDAVDCLAPIVDERMVRSSSGHEEMRLVIETDLVAGPHQWSIELTLAERDDMGFRMLLGRTALRGRFLIDPAQSYVIDKSGTE